MKNTENIKVRTRTKATNEAKPTTKNKVGATSPAIQRKDNELHRMDSPEMETIVNPVNKDGQWSDFIKGIALGGLLTLGVKRSGFLGGMSVCIATAVITMHIMDKRKG